MFLRHIGVEHEFDTYDEHDDNHDETENDFD
jgi:hypothetical protein